MSGKRTLPGLGLTSNWPYNSDNWNTEMDANLIRLSAMTGHASVQSRVVGVGGWDKTKIYLVPFNAAANANCIAIWNNDPVVGDQAWYYIQPKEGWSVFVVDELSRVEFISNGWGVSQRSMNPNMLINGNFSINQRVFAGGALAAGSYGHDRWGAYNGGANYSVTAGLVTLASGTLCQVIETPSANAFSGKVINVSLEGPSIAVNVTIGNGTGADSASGTIPAGSGRQSVSLTVPASISGDLKVRLSAGASVSFRRVKVEMGLWPTGFEDRRDVAPCQRYYAKSYNQNVAPGSGGSANYGGAIDYFAPALTTGQINVPVRFPTAMRAVPTVTFYDLAGTAGVVFRGSNGQPGSTFAVGDSGFNAVATSGANALEFAVHWVANAELACID